MINLALPTRLSLVISFISCAALSQTQGEVQLVPFATIRNAGAIYHMTEAPNGQLAIADSGRSQIILLSADGRSQEIFGTPLASPAAIAFHTQDVGYSACNPAPLASRAFCFSGSSNCPRGAEGVAPGNQSGISYPRYLLGASGGLTSPSFFVSNGGSGEIRLVDPVRRTNTSIAGGFTVTNGGTNSRGPEQIAYDLSAQRLYVADSGKNTVVAIEQRTGNQTTLRSGFNFPYGLVRMSNGNLLISNRGDGTLDEITTDGATVSHYDTGLGANALRGLTVTSKGQLYLLNDQNQTVYQLTFSAQATSQISTVDAGGYRGARVAPGSIAAAFGTGFSPATTAATSSPLPLSLAGTTLTVKDRNGTVLPAQLFFVSPGQVNFVVPASTPGGSGTVTITRPDGTSTTGPVQIEAVAPGLFSANGDGKGAPAATLLRVRADGTQTREEVADLNGGTFVPRPIDTSSATDQLYLIFYGTGIRGRSSLNSTRVNVGELTATVLFAGDQGVFPGLDQVNVLLPAGLRGKGEVDLTLTADGQSSNVLRLNFR